MDDPSAVRTSATTAKGLAYGSANNVIAGDLLPRTNGPLGNIPTPNASGVRIAAVVYKSFRCREKNITSTKSNDVALEILGQLPRGTIADGGRLAPSENGFLRPERTEGNDPASVNWGSSNLNVLGVRRSGGHTRRLRNFSNTFSCDSLGIASRAGARKASESIRTASSFGIPRVRR